MLSISLARKQHLPAINDAGAVDDVERLADIMVGNQDADAARFRFSNP